MKSLFVRIFVLSWLAMTLVGVGFSLYVAASYPTPRMERRAARFIRTLGLQGEELLRIAARDGANAAQAQLAVVANDLENELWLVEGQVARFGTSEATPEVLALAREATPEGLREQEGDLERIAIDLRAPDGSPSAWALVSLNPRPSPVQRVLEREVQRLILIVVVAGLLSLLLARYLARPLQKLREATGRIAQGDLAVRVTPAMKGASAEVQALGRDFDAMAERLEAILESQKRLLRDVSHELRSPLARMGVALELARKRAGAEAQPALDRIERDALRLGELISEILQLTRLEAGDPGGQSEPVAVDELVRQVAADVDFEARGRGRSIAVEVADAARGVRLAGRPELLRRAFENVLRNAARFTPEGTAVECRVLRGPGHLEIAVRDHGPGVPDEHLAEIFRPFFRVESARDRETGGAGIGLAIAQSAVRLHAGSVRAENADGGGLRVVLRLPIREDGLPAT